MKITFKDGITIEITDIEDNKLAIKKAKEIHKEFIEDKKFKDSFKIKDNASVIKRKLKDSYEDVAQYIEYIEKLLDRKEVNYSNVYFNEETDKVILEFNNRQDCQDAFDILLEEEVAKKPDMDLDVTIGQISIKFNN